MWGWILLGLALFVGLPMGVCWLTGRLGRADNG